MNNNTLALVTYEQAKRLKAAGFDWPTEIGLQSESEPFDNALSSVYNHNGNRYFGDPNGCCCSAPTVALALKWMRDVKGVLYDMEYSGGVRAYPPEWCAYIGGDGVDEITITGWRNSYEAAESALLDELLNLIENEKQHDRGAVC